MTSITRRELLSRAGMALGGALSAGVVTAVLGGCRGRGAARAWAPRTLTGEQVDLVAEIAETILPATETPGAKEAGVAEFVDLLLSDWFDDADRERFLAGLAALEATAGERFGRSFVALGTAQRMALLEPLDAAAAELRRAAAEAREEVEEMPFFGLMKEMTVVGYYTSEVGLVAELGYEGFTGTFEGCVPLTETA